MVHLCIVQCPRVHFVQVGGVMAYSTCSLHPIENEAVVAEVLRRAGVCKCVCENDVLCARACVCVGMIEVGGGVMHVCVC